MGELVESITSIEHFLHLRNKFKDIPEFEEAKLRFFLITVNEEQDLENVLVELRKRRISYISKLSVVEKADDSELYLVKLTRETGQRATEHLSCAFYYIKADNTILVVTDDNLTRQRRILFDLFIKHSYPVLSKKFIRSKEIIEVISSFVEEEYFVSTSMMAIKRWWEADQRTGVDYPIDIPIEEVLIDIEKKSAFINSIMLNVYDKERSRRLLRVYLSRKGVLCFHDGHFSLFENHVLRSLLTSTTLEREFLENRAREDGNVRPLKIAFSSVPESNPIEISKHFAQAVTQSKQFTITIFHNGNPYFHANVTDPLDGSLFSIIFHSTDEGSELVLIPQYASTAGSLSRFFSIIFDQFGEGRIEDYVIE